MCVLFLFFFKEHFIGENEDSSSGLLPGSKCQSWSSEDDAGATSRTASARTENSPRVDAAMFDSNAPGYLSGDAVMTTGIPVNTHTHTDTQTEFYSHVSSNLLQEANNSMSLIST